jgi:alkyl sulfatase BDS1-like metallo-beta-lactamase superfamily hydrolase
VLQYAPGETDDQLYVWLPGKKVLLPGDNYLKTFPNLYTIRGSSYRDIRLWAQSLDKMLSEGEIEYLVPSHTKPVIGAEEVNKTITHYRDAIRFVYDETVKGINAGMSPTELSQQVKLPEHLANDPVLQEFYGTVPWSVRSVYSGLIGWFDGNATNLYPLSSKERALRMVKLAGGVDVIRKMATTALHEGDPQWVAELTDHLMAPDENDKEAMKLKAKALTVLGENQTSSNGRNYYLTQAQELNEKSK